MSIISNAQNLGQNQLGTWLEVNIHHTLNTQFSTCFSFTNWNYELLKNRQFTYASIGLNYHFKNNKKISLLYAHSFLEPDYTNKDYLIKEQRIIEQFAFKNQLNNLKIGHRFRLEQRFLDYPNTQQLEHRFRYRIKGLIPISKNVYTRVYDEIMFQLHAFDFNQNRIYGGFGIKCHKYFGIELGYVRQSLKTKNYNRIVLTLNINTK